MSIKPFLPVKYRQKSKDLTPQRVEVLAQLVLFEQANSYSPSVRELAELLNLRSPSTVHAHLESLERQGLVCRSPNRPRAWRATGGGQQLSALSRRAA